MRGRGKKGEENDRGDSIPQKRGFVQELIIFAFLLRFNRPHHLKLSFLTTLTCVRVATICTSKKNTQLSLLLVHCKLINSNLCWNNNAFLLIFLCCSVVLQTLYIALADSFAKKEATTEQTQNNNCPRLDTSCCASLL